MITPSERVLQAVEENFMVIHNILPDQAYAAVTDVLNELQSTLGYCPECWGSGYTVLENTDNAEAFKLPYCDCARGKKLEEVNNANLLAHRPQ